jgi:pimeloyl-ACP methyl ester carboxylesterase
MSVTADLHVVEQGEGEPLVVFVHGVLDRGRSFRRVARALAGECHTVWYDRRGYGAAVDAAGTPAGVDEHVDDLLAVLGGRHAVVVGHSFGGVTALGAALRAPDRVHALVLYETGMAWLPTWDDRFLQELLWGENPSARAPASCMARATTP